MLKNDLETAHLAVNQAIQLVDIMHSLPAQPLPREKRNKCNFVASEACWTLLGLVGDKLVTADKLMGGQDDE